MVEATQMQMESGEDGNLARGTMVTALCWVSRGYAKPVLQEADDELDAAEMREHRKLQKKIAR